MPNEHNCIPMPGMDQEAPSHAAPTRPPEHKSHSGAFQTISLTSSTSGCEDEYMRMSECWITEVHYQNGISIHE